MDIYTPLFSKLIDSSIWDEPDHVRIVFITMLAKKDADMVVRGTAYNIARWSRKSEQDVLDALQVLSSPDMRRVEPQPHDGRRIIKHNEGWLILNGRYYQDLMRNVHRRAYNAEKQREYRRGKPLAGEVKKPRSQKSVRLDNLARERRYVQAESNGHQSVADAISAESLP